MAVTAINKMKTDKAAGPIGIVMEMLKVAGERCINLVT